MCVIVYLCIGIHVYVCGRLNCAVEEQSGRALVLLLLLRIGLTRFYGCHVVDGTGAGA